MDRLVKIPSVGGHPLPESCAGFVPPYVWLRDDNLLYVGPRRGVRVHAALVDRLVVGVTGTFTLEAVGSPAAVARTAWQPARVTCRLERADGRMVFYYPSAGTFHAAELRNRTRPIPGGVRVEHTSEQDLVSIAGRPRLDPHAFGDTAGGTNRAVVDDRIRPILEHLRSDPVGELGVVAAGRLCGLSSSHFQRVFTGATGTTFRRYRLWLRMIQATRGMAKGHNLTRAAADAGFASASHFSDAVRLAFGFTASELFVGDLPVHVA